MNKKIILMLVLYCMPVIVFGAESNSAKSYFNALINTWYFNAPVSVGLMGFAGLKWYKYFNDFNPASAFADVLIPAFITFIAFNWVSFIQGVLFIQGSAK